MTVDKSGSTPTAAVNKNFVGLGDAMVAASNDDKNKTGRKVSSDDADNKRMKDIETEVKSSTDGKAPPIKLDVPVQDQADVAKAKLFFSRLRSNAASLQSAPLETGPEVSNQELSSAMDFPVRGHTMPRQTNIDGVRFCVSIRNPQCKGKRRTVVAPAAPKALEPVSLLLPPAPTCQRRQTTTRGANKHVI